MNIQSWMIKSWATVEWYLPQGGVERPAFWHVNSQIRGENDADGLRSGDTVWVAQEGSQHVGMAWEWVEVRPGLVMLADPNSIITNLQLVDSQRAAMLGLSKTVAINRLVHALPWQNAVRGLLLMSAAPAAAAEHSAELTSMQPGQPLFVADTGHPAMQPTRPRRLAAAVPTAQPSRVDAPPAAPFKERRLQAAGSGHNRASDRDAVVAAARGQSLRKAA